MKKIIFVFLFFLIFVTNKNASFAQENTPVISVAISPTPETKQIDYNLPYPGILPDNRLYFIKVIRDRLISLLISSPLKKAEFDLLVADKRLAAGLYLAEKGNFKLAESTISKGENYFSGAIDKTKEAKRQGIDTSNINKKLSNALMKHKEVLEGLAVKSPKELKKGFHDLLERVEKFEKEVNSLSSE